MKGISIYGEIRIYEGKYGPQTTISNKDANGNWDRMYIDVQLPKGDSIANKTDIQIIKGFLSFYKTKDGLAKIKAVIQEYQIINIEDTGSELPF